MKFTVLMFALVPMAFAAGEAAQGPRASGSPSPQSSASQRYFTDVPLLDQDGVKRRFYSDLLQGKVVIINVLFTRCDNACPVMSQTFARIQEYLGDRLGTDVHMLSISVDSDTDTPAVLKAYASSFKARPGWFFLSGDKHNVDASLQKLGQRVERKEDHSNLFLIGNDRTGLWKKVFGMAPYEEIVRVLETVLNDKG
jgi:protein SCO1/2